MVTRVSKPENATFGVSARGVILIELIVAIPFVLLIVYYMPALHRFRAAAVLTASVLMGWGGWVAFAPYLLP